VGIIAQIAVQDANIVRLKVIDKFVVCNVWNMKATEETRM